MIKYGSFLSAVIILFILFGCRKFEEKKTNKIEGNWLQVIPLATDSVEKVVWSFFDDGNSANKIPQQYTHCG